MLLTGADIINVGLGPEHFVDFVRKAREEFASHAIMVGVLEN